MMEIISLMAVFIFWFWAAVKKTNSLYHEDQGWCWANILISIIIFGIILSIIFSYWWGFVLIVFLVALLYFGLRFVPEFPPWHRVNYPNVYVYNWDKDYRKIKWLRKYFGFIMGILIIVFVILLMIEFNLIILGAI